MADLILTLLVFAAFHMIPAFAPVRRVLIGAIGKAPYIVGYSMISLGLLGWVGIAYSQAEYVPVWEQAYWMRWVPVALMIPACMLLVGALTHANPLSVSVRSEPFNPDKPGIVSITRHPLIWALVLWAVAHMVPNGDGASLLMFGFFAVIGLAGPASLDAKAKRTLGEERWAELAGPTSSVPLLAVLLGRTKIDWANVLCQPLIGGMVLYGILMGGHLFVIGASPLP